MTSVCSRQAVLDGALDPVALVAAGVDALADLAVDLGGEEDLAPARDRLADNGLGLTLGVDAGGVDDVDSGVESPPDIADRVVMVRIAVRPEHHGAERERADSD